MFVPNYPLRFQPTFRQYIWGGRRMGDLLRKNIPSEGPVAESWEVVDHGEDQSVVANGPLQGKTLNELVRHAGHRLLGPAVQADSFPLLFKFLDANRDLSIQVHPDDDQGARLDPPDMGKTEAWYIVDAQPGAKVYAGLKSGVDRATFEAAIREGRVVECLHSFEPVPGDCAFIPARTVHALGQGLLVAEIQQASNTTFRIFDWNRTDSDGNSRPLHIEQSLKTIDFDRGPINPQIPTTTSVGQIQRLVTCDKFILERWQGSGIHWLGGESRFRIVAILNGEVAVDHPEFPQPLLLGDVVLLPGDCPPVEFAASENATWLEMTINLPGLAASL